MIINVKRLSMEDGEELRGAEPAAIMDVTDEDVQFTEPVAYELHAQIQQCALLVTGRLWTRATVRCGRCLRPVAWPVEVGQFVFHQPLGNEDLVDLTPQIREDILLELPQRALCRSNCKGLCPICGKDRNETDCGCQVAHADQRWQALDQLKLK